MPSGAVVDESLGEGVPGRVGDAGDAGAGSFQAATSTTRRLLAVTGLDGGSRCS